MESENNRNLQKYNLSEETLEINKRVTIED